MRWLQISDIHIRSEGVLAGDQALINRFIKDLSEHIREKPVDCIIFTGDLFDRGAWTTAQASSAKSFLKDIYKICSDLGNWGWKDGEKLNRLFYCPGNHDVLREAYYVSSDNHILHRKNILSSSSTAKDGKFTATGDNYKLLTSETFGLFHKEMTELCGDQNFTSCRPYEYRIFKIKENEWEYGIVGINTALLAAQDFPNQVIKEELGKSIDEFYRFHNSLQSSEALKCYKKYDEAIQKKLGKYKNDKNNLCFVSDEAQKNISEELLQGCIPIFFGHHPIDFLSPNAANWVNICAEKNSVGLYLCGHTHKPYGERIINPYEGSLGKLNPNSRIMQVTVGGLFFDHSGYNDASFSIGEIDPSKINKLSVTVSIYVLTKDVFGFLNWQKNCRTETIYLDSSKPIVSTLDKENAVEHVETTINFTEGVEVLEGEEKIKNDHVEASENIEANEKAFREEWTNKLMPSSSEEKGG